MFGAGLSSSSNSFTVAGQIEPSRGLVTSLITSVRLLRHRSVRTDTRTTLLRPITPLGGLLQQSQINKTDYLSSSRSCSLQHGSDSLVFYEQQHRCICRLSSHYIASSARSLRELKQHNFDVGPGAAHIHACGRSTKELWALMRAQTETRRIQRMHESKRTQHHAPPQ